MKAQISEVIVATDVDDDDGMRREVRGDPGGSATVTATQYGPPGTDAPPLPGDSMLSVPGPGSGREEAVGFVDTQNPGKSVGGEHRVYARDAEGTPVCEVWCKKDGSIVLEALAVDKPIEIRTTGPVILDSPDVRLTDAAGRGIAREGDIVAGAINALAPPGTAGGPLLPVSGSPTPSGGVPFAAQIVSASKKATTG